MYFILIAAVGYTCWNEYPYKYRISFSAMRPIIISHFLLDKKYRALKRALKREPFSQKSSDLFEFFQTNDLRTAQQKVLRDFQRFFSTSEMHALVYNITRIKTKGYVDAFGSLYTDTNYLLPHDDRLETRTVAFILYLSTLRNGDGGELCFFTTDEKNNPQKVSQMYRPQENTLLLFPVSKKSWHCVKEVIKPVKRYAIGGWFHG